MYIKPFDPLTFSASNNENNKQKHDFLTFLCYFIWKMQLFARNIWRITKIYLILHPIQKHLLNAKQRD